MLELIAGIAVAFVAVGTVLQPLLARGPRAVPADSEGDASVEFEDIEESASPKVQALLALREIEFDRATGKLSDEDYEELKAKYSRVALDAIRREEAGEVPGTGPEEDAAEALVRKVAQGGIPICPNCGPRPEADAAFCSDCGRPLSKAPSRAGSDSPAFCEGCGAKLSAGAKFCAECGTKVGQEPASLAR